MWDEKSIAKVLKNIGNKYIGDLLIACSVWKDPLKAYLYPPENKILRVTYITEKMDENRILIESEINYELHRIFDFPTNVELVDIETLRNRYEKGYIPEIYIIKHAYYPVGQNILESMARGEMAYSREAIQNTINLAFITFGQWLDDLLKPNIDFAVDTVYQSIAYALAGITQVIGAPLIEAERIIKALDDALKGTISKLIEMIIRIDLEYLGYLLESYKEDSENLSMPEKLERVLMIEEVNRLTLVAYQLLTKLWNLANKRDISPLETVLNALRNALKDSYSAKIEISGRQPTPIIKIKTEWGYQTIEL